MPLKDLFHKQESRGPTPSQLLDWDANGTHPDEAPMPLKQEDIEKDRKKKVELYRGMTPPSQPYDLYARFLQIQEENRRKQEHDRVMLEAQVEVQVAQTAPRNPETPPDFTPLTSPGLPPIDPRIIRNRFGTVSPEPEEHHPKAPKMSPGGCHMGEGSQRISVIPASQAPEALRPKAAAPSPTTHPLVITPGGKHAKAGSKCFSLMCTSPSRSRLNQVSPALPHPSDGSLGAAVHTSAKPICNLHLYPQPPKLVMGEKTDVEGDTPMRDMQGDTQGPVSLPFRAPVLRATNAPAFSDFTNPPTEYSITPTATFEIATPPLA